jgi:membrane protease YdiL (CAAX protease family)
MFEPSEFFQFLQRPQYNVVERKETHLLGTAIKIYLVTFLFLGLGNIIIITILQAFLTLPIDETLEVPASLNEHLFTYFILVAIIAPILEEVIFRLSLIIEPVNIALSISTVCALISHKLFSGIFPIIFFLLIFILIYKIVLANKSDFITFWNRNFKYIFYFLSIMFGLVHVSNYKFAGSIQYLVAPLLIFPQLALGFILSFTRLYYKEGFLICIIIHCLMNLITVSVFLLHNYHL